MGLFDRLRRRDPEAPDPAKALYVHLALDGGIFVIRGKTGEQLWVDEDGLHRELRRAKETDGSLLYSREAPDRDPPASVHATFEAIADYELPIQLLEQPHPEALVPPNQRRTITNDD